MTIDDVFSCMHESHIRRIERKSRVLDGVQVYYWEIEETYGARTQSYDITSDELADLTERSWQNA